MRKHFLKTSTEAAWGVGYFDEDMEPSGDVCNALLGSGENTECFATFPMFSGRYAYNRFGDLPD